MATRIRTLNFLPEVFQTPTNAQFLNATLDQLVAQPNFKKIEGYVGSRLGYGINANSYYVTEPNKIRTDYQLEPGVVFTKENKIGTQDFISYPGIIDALKLENGLTENNSRLFESQIYSWDSFTNLDKIINFNQYYWLPEGPASVNVTPNIVYMIGDYEVIDNKNSYSMLLSTDPIQTVTNNPTIILLRGGTYTFNVNQNSKFWIQGAPGLTGIDPTNPNLQTRDILGVANNGISDGTITFTVPSADAQAQYNFESETTVDIVSTLSFNEINGQLLSSIQNIDGITSLNGLSLLLYSNNSAETLTFYTISYSGSSEDPTLNLISSTSISINQQINVLFGDTYGDRSFYKAPDGTVNLIPYLSAELSTLYYQDESDPDKFGIIKIIENNDVNFINVDTEIIGKSQYTSPIGIPFTNGLKVRFSGNIFPEQYKTGEYYVENVGTGIQLISTAILETPESYTENIDISFDTVPFDTSGFDGASFVPVLPDYITIARNSIDRNAWSRSNRWFHIDVIKTSALFNNNPDLVEILGSVENKAKRPIIEFYPNLKLFNSGVEGKQLVDFIDTRTTNAFVTVADQLQYYPDVNVYTDYTATLNSTNYTPSRICTAASGEILTCDSTLGFRVNDIVNFSGVPAPVVTGVNYYIVEIVNVTQFKISATKNGTALVIPSFSGSSAFTWIPQSTTITISKDDVTGTFAVDQYIADSLDILPRNTTISAISGTSTLTITVEWTQTTDVYFNTTSSLSLVGTALNLDNYALFEGAKIVFTADDTVKNKIFVVRFASVDGVSAPVINLYEDENGTVLPNQQTTAKRGANNISIQYYFDGIFWKAGQTKIDVNQPPLFDVFDINGISFSDPEIYNSSSFTGTKLFSYGIGSGIADPVLDFPLRYSSIENVGDISFDISLNIDTFTYVNETTSITKKINTGYIFNYSSLENYTRELGWQTAISPSIQYQIFQFQYYVDSPSNILTCDIAKLNDIETNWPTVKVLINNTLLDSTQYTVETLVDKTIITLVDVTILENTLIQVLLLSDQVSKTAYYEVPVNLSNNSLNEDVEVVNVGDIRGQYQSIFFNNPNSQGEIFGPNNFRDLGNVVPYGNTIIQNSASLSIVGALLRKPDHNIFNALEFNSREYIKFKTLLVDVVEKSDFQQRYDPSFMLDDALEQITAAKTDNLPFFWSDMLPSKTPFVSNSYSFNNILYTTTFPLTQIYDFSSANYNGVLVYLTRPISGINKITQLVINQDYVVSTESSSLTITATLQPNDIITIKEYNQTYGSYVPNTPTKLGLYPATIPSVVLDNNFNTPTYFIRGHDGSYNKLYGEYIPNLDLLVDFRDQVLLEFELRIYNNLKISAEIPLDPYTLVPGNFRTTDYSYDEWLDLYSFGFLSWIGQNRLDYKTQLYNSNNKFTYNYWESQDKLSKQPLSQGYWRGIYQYFYDTSTPNTTPWEMIGLTNKPDWWDARYGQAPYTSDNLVMWEDLSLGLNYNNGNPVVMEEFIRPGLLQIIPVDSAGNIKPPLNSIVGGYDSKLFRRDWKLGDVSPVELSYRRSSTYPFDLMKIFALMKPAQFLNLGIDLDNYKYSQEFNQYLVNDRQHLILGDVEIYGDGIAKTSYLNWIVDYEKQFGLNATANIRNLLDNLDTRLVYRLAGFSDKTLLKFYVEKGSPNDNNVSLLIPDESFSVLLYDNQPFDRLVYSGVLIQKVSQGYSVYGNSQLTPYFKTLQPKFDGYATVTVGNISVKLANTYFENKETIVPYRTIFGTVQEVSQFLMNYGAYLEQQGMQFGQVENGIHITWQQMVAEFLYWAQTGWQDGSLVTLNPSAKNLEINKESTIVQPLTLQQTNFVLNQNLYPIKTVDLNVLRENTLFSLTALNEGDTISYGQFNLGNMEHGIVFDNVTLFDDLIYNPITGLRQNRIFVRGSKSADWNGMVDAFGFILNQDNIQEWTANKKYTKGEIVKYKNKFWISLDIVPASATFLENLWKVTDYDQIQKGLLPNSSTRSVESLLYYDTNTANLEQDADLLSFSLIGYRPRDYLNIADLTDITQVNVYKNILKDKGTLNSISAFKGIDLPQGGIQYDTYENWAIKTGSFGGVLNNNFVELRLNQSKLTGNPSIIQLSNSSTLPGVQQVVTLNNVTNYNTNITNPDILQTLSPSEPNKVFSDAGYVNFNDVKMTSYFYSGLETAINTKGNIVPVQDFYVRDYAWLANFLENWEVFTPKSLGQVITVTNNLNNTVTVTFANQHNLTQYEPFAIVNFDLRIDGYYIVGSIVDNFRVLVSANLDPSITQIQSRGVGLKLQSQRVDTTVDISTLPLLDSEFRKNTVWVDTNSDGSWAVYRKNINYQFQEDLTVSGSSSLGSAVAYTTSAGYIVTDSVAGTLYRYVFDPLNQQYNVRQIITEGLSYGTAIAYGNDVFVVSEPTSGSPTVYVYNLEKTTLINSLVEAQDPIPAPGGVTNWGSALAMSSDNKWIYISDINNNSVYVYRKSEISGDYEQVKIIDGDLLGLTTSGDQFGYSLSTNLNGDTLIVGTPFKEYDGSTAEWGYVYVFTRSVQNIEVQNSTTNTRQSFPLAWSPTTLNKTVSATNATGNLITLSDVSGLVVDDPIIFTGSGLAGTGISSNTVYYIDSIASPNITIKTSRDATTEVTVATVGGISSTTADVQTKPLYVSVNGTLVEDNNYAVIGSNFIYVGALNAGDIINVSGQEFTLAQTLTTQQTPQIGARFGTSVDTTNYSNEILVGAPYQLVTQNQEGAAYRYTNAGAKYGTIIGATDCAVTSARKLLINGYLVTIPAGDATTAANIINNSKITNVLASASNNRLTISLVNNQIAPVNQKLVITTTDSSAFSELGFVIYTQTQTIECPHKEQRTQFGSKVKFNEYGSVVISAPVGTRFSATTFDFVDDENQDNDTIFDNNATQWVDTYVNAGAVYMFDYLPTYNESITNVGKFVYAQSVNSLDQTYGNQPRYGSAIDFNEYTVIVGTPDQGEGKITVYTNATQVKDWSVYRESGPVVDISKVGNTLLYSGETNNTLVNLDYIDPLQGKILGAARQNIDFISNSDPAGYNSGGDVNGKLVWGADHVGQIWFDTSNVKYVNYHQNNDVLYNSQYWGTLFPGSEVAIYSWISSTVVPLNYTGPGTPFDFDSFTTQYIINEEGTLTPIYYYWVRNTEIIFVNQGKTLADSVIERYLQSPKDSGISYFAPLLPNVFGLYNSSQYINATDTILNIGFAVGNNDDVVHNSYSLIRVDYADDFLPGIPKQITGTPQSLYDRLLDSLAGVDETGANVPDPYLPKLVQSGVLARPRQSLFYDRLMALKNYLIYANTVLSQFPITELKPDLSLLNTSGNPVKVFAALSVDGSTNAVTLLESNSSLSINEPVVFSAMVILGVGVTNFGNIVAGTTYYVVEKVGTNQVKLSTTIDGSILTLSNVSANSATSAIMTSQIAIGFDTRNYWEYANWWAPGYSNATKASYQVNFFADLSTLSVPFGTIVNVLQNNTQGTETYIYTIAGWTRIGLQNGTIKFKSSLWDYEAADIGFDGSFFDSNSSPFDAFPAEETRNIIRALNEQIYTEELLIFRNKSLILLFEYIQSETIESQNYLPWLSKTSLMDVFHTLRELRPIENLQADNQEFLEGYIQETKPYHVVIKEFVFKYTGTDVFEGDITDFDLPSQYNSQQSTFVSPQLVNSDPNNVTTFTRTNAIWEEDKYQQWFANRGLKLSTYDAIPIAKLVSYIALNTTEITVENINSFPINGTIIINDEVMIYNNIDLANSKLLELARGVNGTVISTHIPGTEILINLPEVMIMNSGRGYIEPPEVYALVDTTVYPPPIKPAIMYPVMNGDKVLRIEVVDSGNGYMTIPEIVIEPSLTIEFSTSNISFVDDEINITSVITLTTNTFVTGDLIQYKVTSGTSVGNLIDKQWYYINVLEMTPNLSIGLYTSYNDCVNDANRIDLINLGSGTYTLSLGAKALSVVTASPVRENNVTLKFDRTSYTSQVTDWEAGSFYSAKYASTTQASFESSGSNILLESVTPPISSIFASFDGSVFEITNIENDEQVAYSSFLRSVLSTSASTDAIKLDVGRPTFIYEANTSLTTGNPTNGKLLWNNATQIDATALNINIEDQSEEIITAFFDLLQESELLTIQTDSTNYQIWEIVGSPTNNNTYWTIPVSLSSSNGTGTSGFANESSLTVIWPATENASGSTLGLTIGMPIKFSGSTIGGLSSTTTYYVHSILGPDEFTVSIVAGGDPIGSPLSLTTATTSSPMYVSVGQLTNTAVVSVNYPNIRTVTASQTATNKLTLPYTLVGTGGTYGFYIGLPIFFTGEVFGNVRANQQYYITTVVDGQTFTISESATPKTYTVLSTTTSTNIITLDEENDTLSVNEPIIFNQMQIAGVSGTTFGGLTAGTTYYIRTLSGTNGITVSSEINGAVVSLTTVSAASDTSALGTSQIDTVNLTTATGSMSVNMDYPVSPGQMNGQLVQFYTSSSQYTGVTSNEETLISSEIQVLKNIGSSGIITFDTLGNYFDDDFDNMYVNMPIKVSANIGSLSAVTQYYIVEKDSIEVTVTSTNSTGNVLVCDSTTYLYVDMPIIFTGNSGIGGVGLNVYYYVESIVDSTSFTISTEVGGSVLPVANGTGTMNGLGKQYIQISTSLGGSAITVVSSTPVYGAGETIVQTPTTDAEFSISYVAGGYRAVITNAGAGYAVDNELLINGASVGGVTGTNDLTLVVISIDTEGEILDVICRGDPADTTNSYYLKTISPTAFELYSEPTLTLPVSGINLPYSAIVSTNVVSLSTNNVVLTSGTGANFAVNNMVVFTGSGNVGNIVLGATYYIKTLSTDTITISETPGGSTFAVGTATPSNLTIAKLGSTISLSKPYSFIENIVKYNNRLYVCKVSNFDSEFVFEKWEFIASDNYRLNALDRIVGYYNPTINMPGLDLTQLVAGITYPNVTYLNNPFEPSQQYLLDSEISDKSFTDSSSTTYDLQGAPFTYGYGPEELVPGNVTDAMTMIVNTTPGTTWSATTYQHVGYNTVSREFSPEFETQTVYSFKNLVQVPAQLSVYVVDGTTNLSTRLNVTDYVINWIEKTITLDNPLTYFPVSDKLLVNVYEVGNGNQVVKSNTDVNPLRLNDVTGLYEIYLNYNYYNGIIRNTGNPFNVTASQTFASTDEILFDNVSYFYVNQAIVFAGTNFGNIVAGDTYYVKDINHTTNRITVSDTFNATTGIAGPVFAVTNASGSLTVEIAVTSSSVYTEPVIFNNGVKMSFKSDYFLAPISDSNLEGLAKIVFASGTVDPETDYLAFTLFGDSGEESQYGYTIPETEYFTGFGTESTYNLENYVGGLNPDNAIVELQRKRIQSDLYSIDSDANTITINWPSLNIGISSPFYTGGTPTGIKFNDDGTYVYVLDQGLDNIYQFSLGIPYDLTSAYWNSLSISSLLSNADGIVFNNDGTKMYVIGNLSASERIVQINLRIPFGITSSSGLVSAVSADISTETLYATGMTFNNDGTKLYVTSEQPFDARVFEYDLVVPYEISTLVYNSNSFSVSSQDTLPSGIAFKFNGLEMYVLGRNTSKVFSYTLGTAWDITTATYSTSSSTLADSLSTDIYFEKDGSAFYLAGDSNNAVYQYQLSNWWDVSTATLVTTFSTTATTTSLRGLTFNNAGTTMYIVESLSVVKAFDLQTSFDLTTASYPLKNITAQDGLPRGIAFSTDGSRMFITGDSNNRVYQYDLSIPWMVGTATYVAFISVAAQASVPSSLEFKPDGTKMYLNDYLTENVRQYSLGTPWTISTATFDNVSFFVGTQEGSPYGLSFNNDGTRMFILGVQRDRIYQYDLSTAWDISSATYNSVNLSVVNQETNPVSLTFNNDGTNIFIVGTTNDKIISYTLSQPFDLSVPASISVTTFANTERQYFNSEFDIIGKSVYKIQNISNALSPYSLILAPTSSTSSTGYRINFSNTSSIVVNQTVEFKGTSFGNIETNGKTYFVKYVDNSLNYIQISDSSAEPETAGNFTVGKLYTIINVGTTDFTLIGAASNTVGLSFIATGSGSGTGTASKIYDPGVDASISGVLAVFGGQPAVRVTFNIPTDFEENTLIRIDGVQGSIQLNNNTYYLKKITESIFDLYNSPYDSALYAINDPVTEVSSYIEGGYGWVPNNFLLPVDTVANFTVDAAPSDDYIMADDTSLLVAGTPVYFTQMEINDVPVNTFGGIVSKQKYYVKEIVDISRFTISETIDGPAVSLTNTAGVMNVTQWEQPNVDRLWVTVNGEKVSSSLLKINDINELSILTEIKDTDEIIITTMMPSATPSQEKFFINVDKNSQPTVFRQGVATTTYLSEDLNYTDEIIYVNDVTKLITISEQQVTDTVAISGEYYIGLNVNKNLLTSVSVYNQSKSLTIDSVNYSLRIIDLVPTVVINANSSYIEDGDILDITITEGNRIYVGGEQIGFTTVDLVNNALSGLQRGINTTGTPNLISKYTQVYGFLDVNKMNQDYYDLDWNDGEPLQISNTNPAIFLRTDNNE